MKVSQRTIIDDNTEKTLSLSRASLTIVLVHVLFRFEHLAALRVQIFVVRHRVADRRDLEALALEVPGDVARGLGLADARAGGADADDGLGRFDHGQVRRQLDELAARGVHPRPQLLDAARRRRKVVL